MIRARAVPFLALFAALSACSTVSTRIDSPWRHCPHPPAAVQDAVVRAFRALGYAVEDDRADGSGFRVVGRFADAERTITQIVESRSAGDECEIRLITLAVQDESKARRADYAAERLRERIENEMRPKAAEEGNDR